MASGLTNVGGNPGFNPALTATTGQVLVGRTFSTDGKVILTGTMPSKGAQTFTPGTTNQTISSGQYLSGTQTIAGSSNLVAENIKKGANIFGVVGTLKYLDYGTARSSPPSISIYGTNIASLYTNANMGSDYFLEKNWVSTVSGSVNFYYVDGRNNGSKTFYCQLRRMDGTIVFSQTIAGGTTYTKMSAGSGTLVKGTTYQFWYKWAQSGYGISVNGNIRMEYYPSIAT